MAISYVNSADLGNNGGTTNNLTAAYTVGTSLNRAIQILVGTSQTSPETLTVQYNNVSASSAANGDSTFAGTATYWAIQSYYQLNPTSGNHNVSVTSPVTETLYAAIIELAGIRQSNEPDATHSQQDTVSENVFSSSITPVADNCWVTGFSINNGGFAPSVGAAINNSLPTGDENTENADVTTFNAGTGFGYNIATTNNTELVILIAFGNNVSGISMSFGGQALTQVGTVQHVTNTGWVYCFHKTNPLTGTRNLTASWTTASNYRYSLIVWDNVPGGVTNFASNSGTGATASVTITTAGANDAVAAMFENSLTANGFSATPGAGTQQYAGIDGGGLADPVNSCVDYLLGPSSSQVMSNGGLGASDAWVAVGVALHSQSAFTLRLTSSWYGLDRSTIIATAGPIHPRASTTLTATIGAGTSSQQSQILLSFAPAIDIFNKSRITRLLKVKRRRPAAARRRLLPFNPNSVQPAHVVMKAPIFRVRRIWPRRKIKFNRPLNRHLTYPFPTIPRPPRYNQGIAFRQTLGFVGDVQNFDFGRFGAAPNYPVTTRQSNVVGFTLSSPTIVGQNQNATQDPRLAGNVFNNF